MPEIFQITEKRAESPQALTSVFGKLRQDSTVTLSEAILLE